MRTTRRDKIRWHTIVSLALLTSAAASAPAARAADGLRILSLSPPSGEVTAARSGATRATLVAGNSVEVTFAYHLQSAERGMITASTPAIGAPFFPTSTRVDVVRGRGEARVRFSQVCTDAAPPTIAYREIILILNGFDASGSWVGRLLTQHHAVNFTFRCPILPELKPQRPTDPQRIAPQPPRFPLK